MSDYKSQIANIKAGIDRMSKDVLADTSLEVVRQVSQNTPVETGRAKGNWFLGVNNAVRKIVEEPSEANLSEAEQDAKQIKGDNTVYVSNNLPYIERLNDGYSKKAPANFVAAAAQVARRKVEEIASRGLKK